MCICLPSGDDVGLLLMPHSLNLKTQSIRSVPDWNYKCHKATLSQQKRFNWAIFLFSPGFAVEVNIEKKCYFLHITKVICANRESEGLQSVTYQIKSTPRLYIMPTNSLVPLQSLSPPINKFNKWQVIQTITGICLSKSCL